MQAQCESLASLKTNVHSAKIVIGDINLAAAEEVAKTIVNNGGHVHESHDSVACTYVRILGARLRARATLRNGTHKSLSSS